MKRMIEKKPKAIRLETWMKKAKKLAHEYNSLRDLKDACDKKIGIHFYYIIDDPLKKTVVISPRHIWEGGRGRERVHVSRDCPAYVLMDDGALKQLDINKIIEDITPALREKLNVDEVLHDTLLDQPPEELVEIHERITKPKKPASVKQKPGCIFMDIGGKPGATYQLFLRN